MRIAIVTAFPPSKQSLNEYAFHFVRYLRQKVEVTELYLLVDEIDEAYTSSYEEQGVTLNFVPCWRFNAINNVLKITKAVREIKPDVVLFNIQFASFGDQRVPAALGLMSPFWVKLRNKVATMVLIHNIMETVDLENAGITSNALMQRIIRFFGQIVTRFILRADLVSLTIPKYVEILQAEYGAENVLLAPHGTFEEATAPPEFSVTPEAPCIMTFGKFGTYKRVESLIEAHKILQADGYPNIELVIAGADNPNAKGYLDSMKEQYKDVSGVTYTGYVAEEMVPKIFGDATTVVFPYTSTTGSSGVLHQAGSYGKSAVLPRLGDFAELITEEGFTGEFFDPESVQSLADAIRRLLDDPQHRYEIETQNHLAAHGLPMDDVVDWYLLHFETLLKERKA